MRKEHGRKAKKPQKSSPKRSSGKGAERVSRRRGSSRFVQELDDFANYFPVARELKREIWFFAGPTNSGKTHAALDELAKGESGVYLAPLRLMALEGQEQFKDRGLPASYITGEERDIVEGAHFVASTIEMLDYSRVVDGAIIDEIQMIDDEQRGWAWTNALVGVPAKRVFLTGSPNALPIVKKIADYLGEPLHVRRFQRFNQLKVLDEPSSLDAQHLKPGTAIVCFSRRDVLELKTKIEQLTPHNVSVIYGGLSPDVRRNEARRFRQKETAILVATDAISMGLNLPIKTLLFWKTHKRYQRQNHPLTDNEIKQIAGRAGRYGFEDFGYVGAFSWRSLRRIQRALKAKLPDIEGPCSVRPLPIHIEMISKIVASEKLEDILYFFEENIRFSKELFMPIVTDEMFILADALEKTLKRASLEDKYTFISAPVDLKSSIVFNSHLRFAKEYMNGLEVRLEKDLIEGKTKGLASNFSQLREAEDACKVVILYSWLAYRFPESFTQQGKAFAYKGILNDYISRSLEKADFVRRCKICGAPLSFHSLDSICEACQLDNYFF